MTTEARSRLRRDVMDAEGCCLLPYRDTGGTLTIGYGRNLDANGISALEAEVLLDHDLAAAEQACRQAFAWYGTLNDTRQQVLVEMCFNLGLTRLLGFIKALAAMEARAYDQAAAEMLSSAWASHVGRRATRLARMMREGK